MISKAIIQIMTGTSPEAIAFKALVSDRIYPIIDIPEESADKLSSIYYSVKMQPYSQVKNGPVANDHTVTFLTVAKGYEQSWQIALALRDALQMKKGQFKGIDFRIDRCTSIEDEYEFTPVNMYSHRIVFQIRTAYY